MCCRPPPRRAHLQGFKGKKYRLSEPYIGFNKHKKSTEDKAYIVNGNKGVVVSHRRLRYRQLCSRSTCGSAAMNPLTLSLGNYS